MCMCVCVCVYAGADTDILKGGPRCIINFCTRKNFKPHPFKMTPPTKRTRSSAERLIFDVFGKLLYTIS